MCQSLLISLPPPEGFIPAHDVTYASFIGTTPPFIRQRKYSGARAEGVRYEKKVQAYLQDRFADHYAPGPWIRFTTRQTPKWRWCQPDGLLFDLTQGIITLIEIKYSHTPNAWWQTKHLYAPVLRHLFPAHLWELQFCEIVKWYDPLTLFPEEIKLTRDLTRPSSKFKVHICRP